MREIKFRAWNKAVKSMHYGDLKEMGMRDRLAEMELMQYTGLKDKNGKEIYEGDLLIHTSRNGQKPHPVIFHPPLAAWCGDYGLKYPLQTSELEEVEVIGNIYENKDML